ncbi:MAG: MFS transporter [Pseudomonadota bacterium]
MAGIVALALGYIMSQFYRSFLAVLTPQLRVDPGMTNEQMSTALAAWFIAFALAQFVVGPMLDRVGPKRTAAFLHLVGGAGGAALFSMATAPWMIIVAMGLIGVGCAPVLMAAFLVFRRGYAPARLAVLSAWFIAVGNLGNIAGTTPLAWAVEATDWRTVGWGLAVISALIAFSILVLLRDPPKAEGGEDRGSYVDLFKLRVLWPIFPIMALTYSAIANLRGLWVGPYMDQVHGYDAQQIGSVSFAVAIGMIVGTFAYGPLDTLFNSRKRVIAGGTLILAIALFAWSLDPVATPMRATILLCIAGAAGTSYPVIMAHGLAFIPQHMTGRGATLLNFFSIGGTGLMQFVSGQVYEANAVPDVPVSGFGPVLWLYTGAAALALLIYMFARDAKPNPA